MLLFYYSFVYCFCFFPIQNTSKNDYIHHFLCVHFYGARSFDLNRFSAFSIFGKNFHKILQKLASSLTINKKNHLYRFVPLCWTTYNAKILIKTCLVGVGFWYEKIEVYQGADRFCSSFLACFYFSHYPTTSVRNIFFTPKNTKHKISPFLVISTVLLSFITTSPFSFMASSLTIELSFSS